VRRAGHPLQRRDGRERTRPSSWPTVTSNAPWPASPTGLCATPGRPAGRSRSSTSSAPSPIGSSSDLAMSSLASARVRPTAPPPMSLPWPMPASWRW
jgi:hypothetical protein